MGLTTVGQLHLISGITDVRVDLQAYATEGYSLPLVPVVLIAPYTARHVSLYARRSSYVGGEQAAFPPDEAQALIDLGGATAV